MNDMVFHYTGITPDFCNESIEVNHCLETQYLFIDIYVNTSEDVWECVNQSADFLVYFNDNNSVDITFTNTYYLCKPYKMRIESFYTLPEETPLPLNEITFCKGCGHYSKASVCKYCGTERV
jgi:hypothetical protein